MTEPERDEFARFESFARQVVNTPKPKPSAEPGAPVDSAGNPADDGSEREQPDG